VARPKKNREVSIVHFSFFDLLFGAFGAFVFLMIMQVLATLNMVDIDIQKMVDTVVQEKTALKNELEKYKETDQKLLVLTQQYNQAMDERSKLIEEQKKLAEQNSELVSKLDDLQAEMSDINSVRAELEKKEALEKNLQTRIDKLDQEKVRMDSKNKELESRLASLSSEIESLRQFKKKVAQKGDLQKALEQENRDLKTTGAKLAQDKARLEAELNTVREKLASLNQAKTRFEKKGDVIKTLEEENKKLEKSLDQTKQKLAALKTSPLKLKTTAVPTIIAGDSINMALAAEGGSPPYTWELAGKLPPGLSFNKIMGVISGIPKTDGKYSINLQVKDGRGLVAKSPKDIPVTVIKEYKAQEKKVSPMFIVMAVISTLLLAYILWGKYKAAKRWKKIVEDAKRRGQEGIVIKI
jgi:uncharacterized coiled-coil DUF342 family protein